MQVRRGHEMPSPLRRRRHRWGQPRESPRGQSARVRPGRGQPALEVTQQVRCRHQLAVRLKFMNVRTRAVPPLRKAMESDVFMTESKPAVVQVYAARKGTDLASKQTDGVTLQPKGTVPLTQGSVALALCSPPHSTEERPRDRMARSRWLPLRLPL